MSGNAFVQFHVDRASLSNCNRKILMDDLVATEHRHLAPGLFMNGVDRSDAESSGQNAVERRRGSTALHMTQLNDSRFEASSFPNGNGDAGRNTTEYDVPESIEHLVLHLEGAGDRFSAFGDDDDRRKPTSVMTATQTSAQFVDVEWNLGNQYGGRPSCDTR
jgi:hypothetical protein